MLATIGFIMVIILVYCLITKKLLPPVAFVLLPIIAALVAGFNIFDIGKFAAKGVSGMVNTVSLFVFSISFFSLMNDAGVFDGVVNMLVRKAGTNITAVMLATAAVGIIGHLDGSGATTFIITITAMYPIFQKLKLDRRYLMTITCIAIGVMNVMPWGGPILRAATVLDTDAAALWRSIIPMQVIMVGVTFVMAFIFSFREKRRLKGVAVSVETSTQNESLPEEQKAQTPKWIMYVNYVLTLGVIVLLVTGWFSSTVVFMVALAVGLIVNVPSLKEQNERLKKYGVAAMSMVVTLFAAGIFTGVLSNTKMLDAMAQAAVTIIPANMGSYSHIIVALFAVPLIICLGTDSFYFGLLPVVVGIAKSFGVDPLDVARILIVAENIGVQISPLSPAAYLGLGMLDMDIGEHIKFSFPWVWAISILSVILCIVTGIV